MNYAARAVRKAANIITNTIEDRKIDKLLEGQPIYHVHIRKTAGTSINLSFFNNYTEEDPNSFYQRLVAKNNSRLIKNNKVIVGWNQSFVNRGKFNYAFSHIPFHQLNLKPHIFKFTCLRDPIKRFLSHYNMLMYYQHHEPNHKILKGEGHWLGNSFGDFLKNIPMHHIKNQLHMFSSQLDRAEAFDNIMQLDHIMFTENFADDLKTLEKKLNLQLPVLRSKSYGYKADIPESSLSRLREILDDEYLLLEKIRSCLE